MQDLIHELNVHMTELEMQNLELVDTRARLEESKAEYFELYEMAPCGYITLNQNRMIENVNLTAAVLLDVEKNNLIKRFYKFIQKNTLNVNIEFKY